MPPASQQFWLQYLTVEFLVQSFPSTLEEWPPVFLQLFRDTGSQYLLSLVNLVNERDSLASDYSEIELQYNVNNLSAYLRILLDITVVQGITGKQTDSRQRARSTIGPPKVLLDELLEDCQSLYIPKVSALGLIEIEDQVRVLYNAGGGGPRTSSAALWHAGKPWTKAMRRKETGVYTKWEISRARFINETHKWEGFFLTWDSKLSEISIRTTADWAFNAEALKDLKIVDRPIVSNAISGTVSGTRPGTVTGTVPATVPGTVSGTVPVTVPVTVSRATPETVTGTVTGTVAGSKRKAKDTKSMADLYCVLDGCNVEVQDELKCQCRMGDYCSEACVAKCSKCGSSSKQSNAKAKVIPRNSGRKKKATA